MKQIELITFFSQANFFRLKTEEAQRARFDELKTEFFDEFNEVLTQSDFNILINYHNEQKEKKAAREKSRLEKQHNLPFSGGSDSFDAHIEKLPAGLYVLTCAQNNTDVNKDFFQSLLTYCKYNNAKLLIAKVTYNKNGFQQPLDCGTELWYDPLVLPYLVDGHVSIGDNFHFIANANVLPTAKNPLAGFEGVTTAGINAIIPAVKIALKSVAALKGGKTKTLLATGSCTKPNYILRKAGTVAAIEHNIGAVFVDTVTGKFRHLEQMEGFRGFYDFQELYAVKAVLPVKKHIAALQFGDIHAEKMSEKALNDCIALIQRLKPDNIIFHDVMDFSSRNHHNIKDCSFMHLQHLQNNTIEKDIIRVTEVIDSLVEHLTQGAKAHIIESNHDLAINTYLKNHDFKDDPVNAILYLKCMLALYEHQAEHRNNDFNMLEFVYCEIGVGMWGDDYLTFHKTDESVIIAGVEMGNHGHTGVNGSRGSPAQFRGLGVPMNTGHTHSPNITGKVYTAGCNELEMGYNLGASSWAIAHILTYANGQRQIIYT